ncbi:molybdopterin-guanine dinucleotide biosynthesis protein [Intrasporangium oryzae NRRL B-24470]|uniref:Molybdopterin-guanine dinucleotide biosynthesis protein n=1 Tax=Intrasporangium oryzae NRRL B-24470 TaxID=1386089 RepID=W9G0V9_9MICO|nr:molybdenum cofactor guanylyltransferase [Intrasporangium oryzae]EWS99720.1 molybdopterin-guanine dinucleotide biosynthesis protein [Intrasporangium oryzae NRRL B-24470]
MDPSRGREELPPDRAGGLATEAALVLTGGLSTRMGAHKPALAIGGMTIVARVIDATRPRRTVVVGRAEGVPDGIPVVREDPPLGGPVAALAAGVEALGLGPYAAEPAPVAIDVVLVLAGDLPFVTGSHLDRLVAALRVDADASAAVTVGRGERLNWLCAAWRTTALLERLVGLGDPRHRSMRSLVGEARLATVPDVLDLTWDVDTPADLDAARHRAEPE